jgi:molybdopterin biosynthesis enzyme MoaB
MGLISAGAMIRSLSLFHITLAAVLLRNPQMIANQSIVMVLGQSMQLVFHP